VGRYTAGRNPRPGGDLIITECGKGGSLYSFIKSITNTHENNCELISILWQVLYTLAVMDKLELTHYDLHLGNIFLEDVSQATDKTMIYFVTPTTYVVLKCRKYFCKLFDWDFAYASSIATPEEKKARSAWPCNSYGICNVHQSEHDVYSLFSLLIKHQNTSLQTVIDPTIIEFIKSMFGNLSSHNLNENLLSRITECTGIDGRCHAEKLCEVVKQFGHRPSSLGAIHRQGFKPVCNNGWKPRPGAIESIETIVTQKFIHSDPMKAFNVFQTHELPRFNHQFIPGTYRWNNHVFGLTENILATAKDTIIQLFKKNELIDAQW